MENQERYEALKEIQRSSSELYQVFLDMAVLVEAQGKKINDIGENVASAGAYVSRRTKELLIQAKEMKKRRNWACWIGAVFLVLFLVCLISILTGKLGNQNLVLLGFCFYVALLLLSFGFPITHL